MRYRVRHFTKLCGKLCGKKWHIMRQLCGKNSILCGNYVMTITYYAKLCDIICHRRYMVASSLANRVVCWNACLLTPLRHALACNQQCSGVKLNMSQSSELHPHLDTNQLQSIVSTKFNSNISIIFPIKNKGFTNQDKWYTVLLVISHRGRNPSG